MTGKILDFYNSNYTWSADGVIPEARNCGPLLRVNVSEWVTGEQLPAWFWHMHLPASPGRTHITTHSRMGMRACAHRPVLRGLGRRFHQSTASPFPLPQRHGWPVFHARFVCLVFLNPAADIRLSDIISVSGIPFVSVGEIRLYGHNPCECEDVNKTTTTTIATSMTNTTSTSTATTTTKTTAVGQDKAKDAEDDDGGTTVVVLVVLILLCCIIFLILFLLCKGRYVE